MCNLYRLNSAATEVAKLFSAQTNGADNRAAEVYPAYPSLVVAQGLARTMTWGFPLSLTGKQGQKLKPRPVNNAREDKLRTPFWRDSFINRRCLIPLNAWAEAEGETGRMTRTWYSLPDAELFAVGGMWRRTDEWGDAFTMVMVDGHPQMTEVHDRMPVVLRQEDWPVWLGGGPKEAFALCRTWAGGLAVERTEQRWAGTATK